MRDSNPLTDKTYRPNFDYLVSSYINEYDIRKANINILFYKGVLTYDEYFKYKNSLTRKVDVGWYLKFHPEIKEVLDNGILEVRRRFIEANNLTNNDIISCRNDALFVINKNPSILKFDNIEFINKNTYTSYIKLEDLDIYYFYDPVTFREVLDIKGMSDENKLLHEKYFIEFLLTVLNSLQTDEVEALNIVQAFYDKYIRRELDVGYYRTFNTFSTYQLIPTYNDPSCLYTVKHILPDSISLSEINIDYNLYLIRLLYKYISNICFRKHRT